MVAVVVERANLFNEDERRCCPEEKTFEVVNRKVAPLLADVSDSVRHPFLERLDLLLRHEVLRVVQATDVYRQCMRTLRELHETPLLFMRPKRKPTASPAKYPFEVSWLAMVFARSGFDDDREDKDAARLLSSYDA